MKFCALVAVIILGLVHAEAATAPPPTVRFVDLKKYQGKWFNIARLPAWFQNECARSTAIYTLRPDGTVAVKNECFTHGGSTKSITGTARAVDHQTNARLVVTFDNWVGKLGLAKGDYWILYLDEGYQTAVVGTPNRKYLWILARESKLPPRRYAKLVSVARSLGFDTTRLIKDQW
jgi:apolipoprotein D and lipocalin family protein